MVVFASMKPLYSNVGILIIKVLEFVLCKNCHLGTFLWFLHHFSHVLYMYIHVYTCIYCNNFMRSYSVHHGRVLQSRLL